MFYPLTVTCWSSFCCVLTALRYDFVQLVPFVPKLIQLVSNLVHASACGLILAQPSKESQLVLYDSLPLLVHLQRGQNVFEVHQLER